MKKVKVGLIFGGKSAEHAVSLMSAKAIWENLDRARYEPFLVYISRAGEWALTAATRFRGQELKREKLHSFIPLAAPAGWRRGEAL